jgi:uncharacterized membrane protein
MATPQQRSCCVLQLTKKESVTAVQHAFCTQFHLAGWFHVKLCVKCILQTVHEGILSEWLQIKVLYVYLIS